MDLASHALVDIHMLRSVGVPLLASIFRRVDQSQATEYSKIVLQRIITALPSCSIVSRGPMAARSTLAGNAGLPVNTGRAANQLSHNLPTGALLIFRFKNSTQLAVFSSSSSSSCSTSYNSRAPLCGNTPHLVSHGPTKTSPILSGPASLAVHSQPSRGSEYEASWTSNSAAASLVGHVVMCKHRQLAMLM